MKRLLYIFFVVSALVFTTCQKKPELKIYKLELTEETVAVTPYSATITANYSYPGEIPQIKVYTSTSSSMSNAIETDAALDDNTMTATINNLASETKYFYRFRYSNGMKLIYTEIKDFTTEHAIVVPTLTTIPAASITSNSAVSGGNISDDGGSEITDRGVCWNNEPNPTIENEHTANGTGTGGFISNLTNLEANTIYYVRAYATNGEGTGYGNEITFITSASLSTVSTKPVTDITANSAKCGGNITNSGGMDITARGVCWGIEHNPTISDAHTTDGNGIGEFESEITELNANVTYYVRAYATSSYGTSYGEEREFKTVVGMAVITTNSITGITASSAVSGGNVVSDGGDNITARGVCWATTQNPTVSNSHTTDGTGTGEFVSSITGLTNNVTYYVRAYATNSNGTSYGEERSFTTQEGLAVVTTKNVTSITATSAVSGGEITDDGGFSITARGVCWSTSQNPTTADAHTSDGTGTGSYSSSLTSLTYNTTYYVRAYATNSKGTSYGEEKTFTTNKLAPTVTTTDVTSITSNSAVTGGNVTADGGANVTARGVCYGTSQNPTISGQHTSDGNGTGAFTSTLTGLTANTTYYVRAYATNSEGTSYGSQKTFTTQQTVTLPTVTTNNVTDITQTTAVSGGNVTSTGNGTVSAKGVCWSTSPTPTINNSHSTDGTGTGSYTSSLTSLSPNTTYYVRAYATNEAGTAYGDINSFNTLTSGLTPTVETLYIGGIKTQTAWCNGNVVSNGGSDIICFGACYSVTPNPTTDDLCVTMNGNCVGQYGVTMLSLTNNTTYYVRAYAVNENGTSYGEQVDFTTYSSSSTVPTGGINSLFTVNYDGDKVYFSQGNLQYNASTNIWRFAEEQYHYVGGLCNYVEYGNVYDNGIKCDNGLISSTYSGWIDLFGFGTSGYNHGANSYQPWSSSLISSDYYAYGNSNYYLNYVNCHADWGYNAISNGGNTEHKWRTIDLSEIEYIMYNRITNSGIRFAKAKIGSINGILLFPDDWNSSLYTINNANQNNGDFSDNSIDLSIWSSVFETNGVVFLPAAGERNGTQYFNDGSCGYYRTTYSSNSGVGSLWFTWDGCNISIGSGRPAGYSVRLVHDYQP